MILHKTWVQHSIWLWTTLKSPCKLLFRWDAAQRLRKHLFGFLAFYGISIVFSFCILFFKIILFLFSITWGSDLCKPNTETAILFLDSLMKSFITKIKQKFYLADSWYRFAQKQWPAPTATFTWEKRLMQRAKRGPSRPKLRSSDRYAEQSNHWLGVHFVSPSRERNCHDP